jgi:hypothetical protein
VLDGVLVPLRRHALQLVRPEVVEPQVRTGHQIAHRARHQDLAGLCLGHHPRADVDGDTADLGADHLAVATLT